MTPLFEEYVNESVTNCTAIFKQRGNEYSDTWRDCPFLTLRAVVKEVMGIDATTDQLRAIAAASLVDVKHQRMGGGWKADNLDDGLNYGHLLATCMKKLAEQKHLAGYNHVWSANPIHDEVGKAGRDPLYKQADSAAQQVNGCKNGHRLIEHNGKVCPKCLSNAATGSLYPHSDGKNHWHYCDNCKHAFCKPIDTVAPTT
jgi:hypothetical protein